MKKTLILLVLLLSGVTTSHAQSAYFLTRSDAGMLYRGFQYALENSPASQSTQWLNAETGLSGSTIPMNAYRTTSGQYCRQYYASLQVFGVEQQAHGTACRQAQGDWKIVSERQIGRYVKLVRVVQEKPAATGCRCGHSVGQSVRLGEQFVAPQAKADFNSRRHPGKDCGQGDRKVKRVLPSKTPPPALERYPSRRIKLVDYRAPRD